MNSEIQASETRKFDLIVSVEEDNIEMYVDSESYEPSVWEIQKVLMLMCLQIGNQLNEERDQNRPRQDDPKN
jgi:hypothetical protein